jgi:hypothetical protein
MRAKEDENENSNGIKKVCHKCNTPFSTELYNISFQDKKPVALIKSCNEGSALLIRLDACIFFFGYHFCGKEAQRG